jgi:hypothetical protein
MIDTTSLLFASLVFGGIPATLITGLSRAQKSKSRLERWGWVVATVGSVVTLGWLAVAAGQIAPLLSLVVVLVIASFAMPPLVMAVHGVQGITHYGWNSRKGLSYWIMIVEATIFAYWIFFGLVHGNPLRNAETAAGLALGLIGGALMVRTPPRWPTRPLTRKTILTYILLLAGMLGYVFWIGLPLTNRMLILLVLIAFQFTLMLVDSMYPEDSDNKELMTSTLG